MEAILRRNSRLAKDLECPQACIELKRNKNKDLRPNSINGRVVSRFGAALHPLRPCALAPLQFSYGFSHVELSHERKSATAALLMPK
jgi:hypothetical protein